MVKVSDIMTKVKIVHVLDIFPSKSETFIINLISETLRNNYLAQVLANVILDLEASSQKESLKADGLYEDAETYNPVLPENKIKRVGVAMVLLLKNFKYSLVFLRTLNTKKYGLKARTLKMWFQAGAFLKHRDADIFHAHFGLNGKLLAEMKEIGAIKGKIIVTFYGYDTYSTTENRAYFKNYYLGIFNRADHIITSSNYLSENLKLLNVPAQKLFVNSVGVNLEKFYFKRRTYNGTIYIITVGRLIYLKGQHIGVDVVHELKNRGHKLCYTILGSGDESNALRQKINDLGLKKEISLKNGGNQNQIIQLLHRHHLFLMTSVTDNTGRAEGQGLVTAEAQATGMPVVGFNSGGVPETIQDGKTGFIVEEGNINNMADAIEKFILNPDLISTFGKEAREFVDRKFNNKTQTQNIIDLYQH